MLILGKLMRTELVNNGTLTKTEKVMISIKGIQNNELKRNPVRK